MTLIPADSEGNRCEWVGGAVDALMTYWLEGTDCEDAEAAEALKDWWVSDDAADAALHCVYLIRDAIANRGWDIVKRAKP